MVVWCTSRIAWARVRRWQFAHPYAVATKDGVTVAVAFTIPRRKARFAQRALGLPVEKRPRTARQAAHDDKLRVQRRADSRLRPRVAKHESQYFDEGNARQEVQS